jgi:transcription elongation factor GreA
MHDKPYFVSQAGLEKMKQELHYLKTEKRRELADRIEKAKELGDLRENADYQEAKDELMNTEGHILELDDALKRAVIIENQQTGTVTLGSKVEVEFNGKKKEFNLVGSHEANPLNGLVSNESPLGMALLGKKVGDTAEVKAPAGIVRYRILSVK